MSADDLDPNKKYINGPVNVARLEGQVGSVKKVIYLFMDFHIPIEQQLKCTNIYADDVQKYILNGFTAAKRDNRQIDFFFEIDPFPLNQVSRLTSLSGTKKIRDKSLMYVHSMALLFLKLFNYNKEKHKVFSAKYLENVRIHYADMRHMFRDPYSDMMLWGLGQSINDIYDTTGNQFNYTINRLSNAKNQWTIVKKISEECFAKNTSCNIKANLLTPVNDQTDFSNRFKYIFHKMIYKYNHPDIQKILTDMLKSEIQNINKIIKLINQYGKLLIKIYKMQRENFHEKRDPTESIKLGEPYLYDAYTWRENVQMEISLNKVVRKLELAVNGCQGFMDIYFLRRFLDKDYINTVIAYTGAAHSTNYIQVLLKHFNFRITHISNANGMTIDQLNESILKTKHHEEVEYIIYPDTFGQCSDMTTFPPNFK